MHRFPVRIYDIPDSSETVILEECAEHVRLVFRRNDYAPYRLCNIAQMVVMIVEMLLAEIKYRYAQSSRVNI